MGNGMNKVLPGLYVGNYRDSKDAQQLDRFNITHIVAIHDAARKLHSDKHYLCVMAADTPDQNLTQYFPLCNDFIHAARLRGGNVLIHCLAGMSRSVTVAVAYIMSVTSLNWKEALKVVRVGRSVANPNFGFQKQLQEFEIYRLSEERRRLKERFPSRALAERDEKECRILLNSYQGLLLSKDLCEGKCAFGEVCPTGLCRSPSKRILRRKSSTTPPQSPRMLPPTPTAHSRSSMSLNNMSGPSTGRRPRSGPGGLSSYAANSSAPSSRSGSRYDLTAVAGSSSRERDPPISSSVTSVTSRRDFVPQSAPSSPQNFPRRAPIVPLHELDS
ncbi:dual specificity protein phosphatase 22-like [Macrosteles quadrilineatus]|uniref:dual specificity protein phosphatase 22-like n=1 Tax=Macrosteles quadrilineatus TaxID=74068 RepID=UPI0023E2D258|nr:dual specificity protein phosphatase 22-like [Macrosteles quadrilineatus]XP_054288702.1 dual specificity protein phosphatase 22-like [Macrosteles quadrilineatus]